MGDFPKSLCTPIGSGRRGSHWAGWTVGAAQPGPHNNPPPDPASHLAIPTVIASNSCGRSPQPGLLLSYLSSEAHLARGQPCRRKMAAADAVIAFAERPRAAYRSRGAQKAAHAPAPRRRTSAAPRPDGASNAPPLRSSQLLPSSELHGVPLATDLWSLGNAVLSDGEIFFKCLLKMRANKSFSTPHLVCKLPNYERAQSSGNCYAIGGGRFGAACFLCQPYAEALASGGHLGLQVRRGAHNVPPLPRQPRGGRNKDIKPNLRHSIIDKFRFSNLAEMSLEASANQYDVSAKIDAVWKALRTLTLIMTLAQAQVDNLTGKPSDLTVYPTDRAYFHLT
ncbi:unnamed protein product, partial [Iphiclides podalirius]